MEGFELRILLVVRLYFVLRSYFFIIRTYVIFCLILIRDYWAPMVTVEAWQEILDADGCGWDPLGK